MLPVGKDYLREIDHWVGCRNKRLSQKRLALVIKNLMTLSICHRPASRTHQRVTGSNIPLAAGRCSRIDICNA